MANCTGNAQAVSGAQLPPDARTGWHKFKVLPATSVPTESSQVMLASCEQHMWNLCPFLGLLARSRAEWSWSWWWRKQEFACYVSNDMGTSGPGPPEVLGVPKLTGKGSPSQEGQKGGDKRSLVGGLKAWLWLCCDPSAILGWEQSTDGKGMCGTSMLLEAVENIFILSSYPGLRGSLFHNNWKLYQLVKCFSGTKGGIDTIWRDPVLNVQGKLGFLIGIWSGLKEPRV